MNQVTTDTIRNRKSVRTFTQTPLSEAQLEEIRSWIQKPENPFDVPVQLYLIRKDEHHLSSPVLVNDDWYIAGKVPAVDHAEEAFGYAFEDLILKARAAGLGMVWLAATIKRPAFEEAIELQKDERMPAVSPIGYASQKRSNREKLIRKGMQSDTRVPFSSRFFDRTFETPLQEEKAGIWMLPLEMVRLAPSATNKQPWRLIVDGNQVHFYEQKTKGYANEDGDIQKADLGIAMRHFDLACEELGIKGKWIVQDPGIAHDQNVEYIATWQQEQA